MTFYGVHKIGGTPIGRWDMRGEFVPEEEDVVLITEDG